MTQTTPSEHVVARPPGSDHQYVSVDGDTYCIETLLRLHRAGMLRSDHPAFDEIAARAGTGLITGGDEERISQLVRQVLSRDADDTNHDMLFVSEPVLLAAQQRLHELGYRAHAEFGYTYSTLTIVQ